MHDKNKLSNELVSLSTLLTTSHKQKELAQLTAAFSALMEKVIEAETETTATTKAKTITATLKFTQKEISKMSKTFKKEFIANGLVAHVTKRESGKRTFCYEIRYRSNGYNISASSTDLQEAKRKFIEKTLPENIGKHLKNKIGGITALDTFHAFSTYFFENFRKEKVATETYRNDVMRYNKYLKPYFWEKEIKKITPSDCKKLLDEVKAAGKGQTADELYSLMSIIFKGAIAHGIIERNPLNVIFHVKHERKSGKALTKDEETSLFKALNERIFAIAAALMLYCGLRPNELKTAKIDEPFIIAVNSKRKHQKTEYKRIPIIDKLRPFLVDGVPDPLPTIQLLRRRVNAVLPNHKLYDLRTTFYTRCDESGVSSAARDEFVGHSGGALTNAYRDLSTEYLLQEGEKLNVW